MPDGMLGSPRPSRSPPPGTSFSSASWSFGLVFRYIRLPARVRLVPCPARSVRPTRWS